MNNCTDCEGQVVTDCKEINASCVSVPALSCIGTTEGDKLNNVLETLDQFFCEFSNVALLSCLRIKLGFPIEQESTSYSLLLTAIQQYLCNFQDVKVKSTQSDVTSGYLYDKITTGECLDKSVEEDESGNQKVKISIDWSCLTQKIPACFSIETDSCFTVEPSSSCTPQPLTPVISKNGTSISGINCNGVIQWYNSNNQLVGSGSTITVNPNDSYYAKCATNCGESVKSNTLVIPNIVTYTKTRTAIFVRNNCGVNECNVPCLGTSTSYSRTYTSQISQEVVDSIAQNDEQFSVDGQAFINLTGDCTCADCNCVFPVYNSNIVTTQSTCSGSVILANGQILIAGISNANRFGYSFGNGDYSGPSYSGAIQLNTFTSANVETTPSSIRLKSLSVETRVVFRIFNGDNTCYKDVVVVMTPPNCADEQVDIVDVSVSCDISDSTCISYTVIASGSGASGLYQPCSGGHSYLGIDVGPNNSITICAKEVPVVSGGSVQNNGIC